MNNNDGSYHYDASNNTNDVYGQPPSHDGRTAASRFDPFRQATGHYGGTQPLADHTSFPRPEYGDPASRPPTSEDILPSSMVYTEYFNFALPPGGLPGTTQPFSSLHSNPLDALYANSSIDSSGPFDMTRMLYSSSELLSPIPQFPPAGPFFSGGYSAPADIVPATTGIPGEAPFGGQMDIVEPTIQQADIVRVHSPHKRTVHQVEKSEEGIRRFMTKLSADGRPEHEIPDLAILKDMVVNGKDKQTKGWYLENASRKMIKQANASASRIRATRSDHGYREKRNAVERARINARENARKNGGNEEAIKNAGKKAARKAEIEFNGKMGKDS